MVKTLRIALGGDAMLGRLVREHILGLGVDYPLGQIADRMQRADLAIVNLECALTDAGPPPNARPKAFRFMAPPRAVESLERAGVGLVSLANNHAMDAGAPGLLDTLKLLDAHGIAHAGAGRNLQEARGPAVVERGGTRIGMVAFCDHQADFAATDDSPGIAYVDLRKKQALETIGESLAELRRVADTRILSFHWGPNMVERPSTNLVQIAHAAVEAGAHLVFGHSAHVFQGIEFYGGAPILYAAGDLVDDYRVDADLRNDLSLLFELELEANRVRRIRLHPVRIERCRTAPAEGEDARFILERARRLCGDFGTVVASEGDTGLIEAPAAR